MGDERILDRILTYYQIPTHVVRRMTLSPDEIGPAIRQKRVVAIYALGPTGPGPLANAVTAVAKASKGALDILEIEAAEAIAKHFPVLEEAEIAPGAFGATPLRPAESVTTLAVTLRLVARSSMPNYVAGEIARLLFTTKARLVVTLPQVGRIEAPDTDKGAALPVHPGAAAYFDGEQTSVLERFESFFYPGMIIVSLLGSAFAWIMSAWRGAGPNADQAQLLRLLAIFREAPAVDLETLDALDKEVEAIDAWALERVAYGSMEANQFNVFSLIVAQVSQAIDKRRTGLRGQPSASSEGST